MPEAATLCKDAIKLWAEHAEQSPADAEDVRLCPIAMQLPLITKMDASLANLKKCKHLRLSTNAIDRINHLHGMDSLQILSLGRNQIKKIEALEPVADTLEQLWLSYNQIASLAGVEKLPNLQVLYMSNNRINSWSEVERLSHCPKLRDLLLVGNPLHKSFLEANGNDHHAWRIEVLKRVPSLKIIDGQLVDDEEREEARSA